MARRTAPLTQRSSFWWTLFGIASVIIAGTAVVVVGVISPRASATPAPSSGTGAHGASIIATATMPPAGINLNQLSIDDPRSLWVVIDKRRHIQPKSWIPQDLVTVQVARAFNIQMRRPAAIALKQMFDAFLAQHPHSNLGLKAVSGYRSYSTQKHGWDGNYTLTALPGYSEHQSGLAMDIGDIRNKCSVYDCYANQPEGKWLAANAWNYGFILRYPKGYTNITGYQYEPWHYRYVGVTLSTYMHDNHIMTLEQVFQQRGVVAAGTYGFGGH